MSKLTGLVVLLGGIGVLAHAMPSGDEENRLAQVTKIGTHQPTAAIPAPVAASATIAATPDAPRTFSPQQPLLVQRAPAATQVGAAAPRPDAAAAAVSPTSHSVRVASARPGDEESKQQLARNLQKELKRVGCYDGELTGAWSAASRKAMAAFTDRVNATLPVDEPDYILLTLVQGHTAQACGKGCPAGQTAASEGRCLPSSFVTAQAQRRKLEAAGTKEAAARKPVERRVATAPAGSGWSTTTTAAPIPRVPADLPPTARPEGTVIAATPLPGRMTVGAATGANVTALTEPVTRAPLGIDARGPRTPQAAAPADDRPPAQYERTPTTTLAARKPTDFDDEDDAARRSARPDAPRGAPVYRRAPPPSAYAYRPPVVRYTYAPQPVPPTTYSSASRNWKSTIFSDITRMR
jgi:hypothetical protein